MAPSIELRTQLEEGSLELNGEIIARENCVRKGDVNMKSDPRFATTFNSFSTDDQTLMGSSMATSLGQPEASRFTSCVSLGSLAAITFVS